MSPVGPEPSGPPEGGDDAGRATRRRYLEEAPRAPEGPVDLPSLVPGAGPLELDVGFGRGLSLRERAKAAPASRLIGLEIRAKWAFLAAEALARQGLDGRVRALHEDARALLPRAGPDGCLARVFLHFPDPWWKKRHAKRRVVDDDLLHHLARLIEDGGELFVQTDVSDRAEAYRALLDAHPAFTLAAGGAFLDENPFGARSNRERRAALDGLPVYRLLATRAPR